MQNPGESAIAAERRPLHEEVAERLRGLITEGQLAPGARLNERVLCEQIGVSRTPLREAIKTLASEGLVEIVPAKGAIVRRFSEEDTRQILEVLKILEQAGARLACLRASDADIRKIAQVHKRMMALYKANNRLAYFKLNQSIHTAIVQASGNAALAQTHETLQARIKRIRFVGNETPDRWAAAVAEHEEMIEALEARDGEKLAEVLGRHLDKTVDRVRDAI